VDLLIPWNLDASMSRFHHPVSGPRVTRVRHGDLRPYGLFHGTNLKARLLTAGLTFNWPRPRFSTGAYSLSSFWPILL
jgi:hypothetical protein